MRLSTLAGSTEAGSSTAGSEALSTQSATPPRPSPLCGSDDTDIFASNPIAQHMAMYAPNSPLIARYMQEVAIPEDSAQTSAVHAEYRRQLEATNIVRQELSCLREIEGFSSVSDDTFDITETIMGTEAIDIASVFETAKPDEPAPAATVTYLTTKNAPQRQERLGEPSSARPPAKPRKAAQGDKQPKPRRSKSGAFMDTVVPAGFKAIAVTPFNAEPDELNIKPSPKKSKSREVAYLFVCSLCPDLLPSRLKSDVVRHLEGCEGAIVPFKSEERYLCRHCDQRTDTLKGMWNHERKCKRKPAPRNPHDQESRVDLTQPENGDSSVPPTASQDTPGVPESSEATAGVGNEVAEPMFKVPALPNARGETAPSLDSELRMEFYVPPPPPPPPPPPVQVYTQRPSSPSESSLTSLGELAEALEIENMVTSTPGSGRQDPFDMPKADASPDASPVKHGQSSKGKVAAMQRRKSAQSSSTRSIGPKKRPAEEDGYLADAPSKKRGRPPNSRTLSAKKRSRPNDSEIEPESTSPADLPKQKRSRLTRPMDDVGKRGTGGGEQDYRPSSPEASSDGELTRKNKATRRASSRARKPIRRGPTSSDDDEKSLSDINIFSDEHTLRTDPATTFSEAGRPQRRSAIHAHQNMREMADYLELGANPHGSKGSRTPESRPVAHPHLTREAVSETSVDAVAPIDQGSPPPVDPEQSEGLDRPARAQSVDLSDAEWMIQDMQCMKLKTAGATQCVRCVKHTTGDVCRFLGLRELLMKNKLVYDERLLSHQEHVELEFPTAWNVKPKADQVTRIKATVATALLPIIQDELKHISQSKIIFRNPDMGYRAICDICKTSLFSGCWLCRVCGREICGDCYDFIRQHDQVDVTTPKPTSEPGRIEKSAHYCVLKRAHYAGDFVPVSRFSKDALDSALRDMPSEIARTPVLTPLSKVALEDHKYSLDCPEDISGITSLPLHFFSGPLVPEDAFQTIWAKGEPILVDSQLDRFRIKWDPEYFTKKYGKVKCEIVDCLTENKTTTTVASFFKQFGIYGPSRSVLKLKDWPPASDFRQEFPSLFEDFSSAVPVPNYTRRDGILNIASHFPAGSVAPDIGPKMYNAFEASETQGGLGSTRLHMDMADAINVMLFASPRADGSPGFAAWNIFRAEDAGLIREFLREKHPELGTTDDPIHLQRYFLDSELRKELFDTRGVQSWRINQRPGQAVFIPAGCAHQVSNCADCIKVAVDFVSPENVERCSKLTEEFRRLNLATSWKEDVLQLRNMMWYAWLSSQQLFPSEPTSSSD